MSSSNLENNHVRKASAPATRPSPQQRVRRLTVRKASPPRASHSTHAMVSPARSETATAKGTEVQKTSGGTSSATIVAVGHETPGAGADGSGMRTVLPHTHSSRCNPFAWLPPAAYSCRYMTNAPEHSRSEEHTSELQSLLRIPYSVLCLTQTQTTTRS